MRFGEAKNQGPVEHERVLATEESACRTRVKREVKISSGKQALGHNVQSLTRAFLRCVQKPDVGHMMHMGRKHGDQTLI